MPEKNATATATHPTRPTGAVHPKLLGQFTARTVPGDMLTITPAPAANLPEVRADQQTVSLTIGGQTYHGLMWSERLHGNLVLTIGITIETAGHRRPHALRDAGMHLLHIRQGTQKLIIALPSAALHQIDKLTATG